MTLSPDLPQREVTPEERKRSARLFWTILLLFPMVVGVMVAYLSVKGRQVRDYGQAVAREVMARPTPLQGSVPCSEIATAKAPAPLKSCTVSRQPGGAINVTIKMDNGQEYRVTK